MAEFFSRDVCTKILSVLLIPVGTGATNDRNTPYSAVFQRARLSWRYTNHEVSGCQWVSVKMAAFE